MDADLPDTETEHTHFHLMAPEGELPLCPDCGGACTGVEVCTMSDYVVTIECEHELSIEQFQQMVSANIR